MKKRVSWLGLGRHRHREERWNRILAGVMPWSGLLAPEPHSTFFFHSIEMRSESEDPPRERAAP